MLPGVVLAEAGYPTRRRVAAPAARLDHEPRHGGSAPSI